MTAKVHPYKKGFGPFAPEVYRAPGPYPYRGVSSAAAIEALEDLFRTDVDPESVACVVLEPVQGEGGFIPMPPDYLPRLQELCRRHGILYVDDEVQSGIGRTGKMWAVEHYDGVEPDLVVSREVDRRRPAAGRGHRPGRGHGRGARRAGSAAPSEATRSRARPPSPSSTSSLSPTFLDQAAKLGETMRARLDDLASRHSDIGEVRGLGPMLAFEFAEQTPERAKAVTAAAFERGLVLLSCGLHGNVIRLLPPLTIAAEELDEGFGILEESLAA